MRHNVIGNAVKMAGLIALELEDRNCDGWSVSVGDYDVAEEDAVLIVRTRRWSVEFTAAEVEGWRSRSAEDWIALSQSIVREREDA